MGLCFFLRRGAGLRACVAVPMFLKESCMRASREEAGRMSAYMNGLLTGLRNEESQ